MDPTSNEAHEAHTVLHAGQAGRLRYVLLALLAGASWLAVQRDWGTEGENVAFYCWLLVAFGLLPAARYLTQVCRDPEHAPRLPFLPIVGIIYVTYYALPPLVRDHVVFMRLTPRAELIEQAVRLALLGWLALLVAFYWVAPRLPSPRPVRVHWNPERARRLAPLLLAVGLLATLVGELLPVPASLKQIVFVIQFLVPISVGIYVILALRCQLGDAARHLVWWLLVPFYLALQLPGGAVAMMVFAAIYVLMLVWAVRRSLPWLVVVPLGLGLVLFKGNLDEFRYQVGNTTLGQELGALERAQLIVDLVGENVASGRGEAVAEAGEFVLMRASQIALLAHAIERTPTFIPHAGGTTYRSLPGTLIPRFLWPGKPTKELGQWFGHEYGLLAPDDVTTGVNMPQIVELYVNFGALGVILGMALIGWIYRLLDTLLNAPQAGDAALLAGAVVFSRLVNIESDASLVFGLVAQVGVMLFFVLRALGEPTVGTPRGRRTVSAA
jgi:hypothetical protein